MHSIYFSIKFKCCIKFFPEMPLLGILNELSGWKWVMVLSSDNINGGDRLILKGNEQYEMISSADSLKKQQQMPNFADEIKTAINQLNELENSDKLREDAIKNGKAIIKNWQPPTDEQIQKIFLKMSKELLA